jgi:hypothetical protein
VNLEAEKTEEEIAEADEEGTETAGAIGTSKHLAFALALVLDELRLHVRDLPAEVRVQVVTSCR